MNVYSCTPGAEPGTFILSIEFGELRWMEDDRGVRPCPGIRGFYRARFKSPAFTRESEMPSLAWPGQHIKGIEVIDDVDHLLGAIRHLESYALRERPQTRTL